MVLIENMEPKYKFYYKNDFRPLASLSLHEVAAMECPSGYVLPLEKPDSYALYFVMAGKGVYTLGGTEFPVAENDLFVMYPDTEIQCRADKDDPWTLRAVSFDGADALLLLNAARFDPKTPVRHLEEKNGLDIVQCIAGIYTYRGQEIYGTTQSTAILYAMMSMLVRTAAVWDQSAMPPGWTGAVHLKKAMDFIAENYSKPITVKDIADHVHLDRSRLYRLFLDHVFISPKQYLSEYRIRTARTLLEQRKGSIKEIACAVGIDDPYRFSIQFKQMCGKTPTEYMKYLINQGDGDADDEEESEE